MFKNQYVRTAIIISAIMAPFVFYSSPMKPWKGGENVTIFQEFIYPFEYITHATLQKIGKSYDKYIELTNVQEENAKLRKNMADMQVRIMNYKHQALENQRLRKLLGFSKIYNKEHLIAEVIKSTTNTPFNTMRISAGSMDQVEIGMPVIASTGVVGRIIRTGLKFSDVHILQDINFYMDVLVERTRTRGVLQGYSNQSCHLQLHKRSDIKIGDTLISSGIIGSFPKGLPVGKVVKISYQSDNVAQVITVKPWVDYQSLEEVFILKKYDPEIATIKKIAGDRWFKAATSTNPAN